MLAFFLPESNTQTGTRDLSMFMMMALLILTVVMLIMALITITMTMVMTLVSGHHSFRKGTQDQYMLGDNRKILKKTF